MIDLNDTDATTRQPGPDAGEIDAGLRADVRRLVESLRPGIKPTPGGRTGTEQRYGSKGSLAVTYAGPDMGRIVDFEAEGGMSPLGFVMRERGCGYGEAVEWAAQWLGMGAEVRPLTHLPKAKVKVEAVPDPSAVHQHRVKLEAIMRYTGAAAGTPAAAYLAGRGINSVPPCIGWNALEGAMVCRATDDAGTVQAVQLVYVSDYGHREPRSPNNAPNPSGLPKRTLKGHPRWTEISAMRCPRQPGAADDVVVVAEGPETALSIWCATGLETWAVFSAGNLRKAPVPAGKRVVIALDIGAELQAYKAAAIHQVRSCKATVAVPPTDEPKADFNDVLQQLGPEAVRRAVFAALTDEILPFYPDLSRPAPEAIAALRAGVDGFFAAALAPQAKAQQLDLNDPPPALAVGIKGGAGLGKSEAVLDHLIRPELRGKYVSYYGPSHRLNDDLAARFNAKSEAAGGPRAVVIRGRDQKTDEGLPMCHKADVAQAVARLGHNVSTTLCKRKAEHCEHYQTCSYIAQMADTGPAVRIMPHSYAFVHGLPKHLHGAINVIDESFWRAALRGEDGRYWLPLDSITRIPYRQPNEFADSAADTARLVTLNERLQAVLATIHPTPAALLAAGISAADARFATGMWYGQVEDLGISPGMKTDAQRKRLEAYRAQLCLKLARLWTLVGDEIDLTRDELRSIRVHRGEIDGNGHIYDRVTMCWSSDLTISNAPTLLIDADLEAVIARRFLPHIADPVVIEARRSTARVTQITDRTVSREFIAYAGDNEAKAKTARNNAGKLYDLISAEAQAAAPGDVLCVTYAATEEALRAMPTIANVDFGHFNAIRGLDHWRDVATVIVAGRIQPGPAEMETNARALLYRSDLKLSYTGQYIDVQRGIRMADGSAVAVRVHAHPDPTIDMLLRQIRDCELTQAIDRARLIHRPAGRPCRVLILTNVPVNVTVDEVTTWDALIPDTMSKLRQAVAVPLSDGELARCWPDSWKDKKATENWRARNGFNTLFLLKESLLGEKGYLIPVTYRRLGQRGKPTQALVDSRQPDLRAALESVVGPVIKFEVETDARPAMTDADEGLHPSACLRRTRDMVMVAKPVAELSVGGRPLVRKSAWPRPKRWLGLVIDLNEAA